MRAARSSSIIRYRGARAASEALARLRRVALGGYALPGFADLRFPHLVKHSLPVSRLGAEAPRGVVIEHAFDEADVRDSMPDPAIAAYLWRRGSVVAGISFTAFRATEGGLRIGGFAQPQMLRLARSGRRHHLRSHGPCPAARGRVRVRARRAQRGRCAPPPAGDRHLARRAAERRLERDLDAHADRAAAPPQRRRALAAGLMSRGRTSSRSCR